MCVWTVTPRFQNRTSQIGYTVRKFFSIAMVMHLKGQSSSNQQSCTAAHAINLLLDIVHQMRASKLFKLQILPSLPALCQCTFPLLSFNYHVTHLQTCRLTGGIFTHHSPIPLRKCFLPGVMRSELYSLPYVSTPNVSCLTEMVREREKKTYHHIRVKVPDLCIYCKVVIWTNKSTVFQKWMEISSTSLNFMKCLEAF